MLGLDCESCLVRHRARGARGVPRPSHWHPDVVTAVEVDRGTVRVSQWTRGRACESGHRLGSSLDKLVSSREISKPSRAPEKSLGTVESSRKDNDLSLLDRMSSGRSSVTSRPACHSWIEPQQPASVRGGGEQTPRGLPGLVVVLRDEDSVAGLGRDPDDAVVLVEPHPAVGTGSCAPRSHSWSASDPPGAESRATLPQPRARHRCRAVV